MNITTKIINALAPLGLPPPAVGMYELGEGEKYPDAFIVITPGTERNEDIADNEPLTETTDADVNLYVRGNYQATKDQMKSLLETAGFYLTYRGYVAFEKDTGHHHYVITVQNKEVL